MQEFDVAVRTDCLRTGDRCTSFLYGPATYVPLGFGGGNWTEDLAYDGPCPAGGTSHVRITAVYPLPEPRQNPITLLTGHAHQEESGAACVSNDVAEKYARTGDWSNQLINMIINAAIPGATAGAAATWVNQKMQPTQTTSIWTDQIVYQEALAAIQSWQEYLRGGGTVEAWLRRNLPQHGPKELR